MCALDVAVCKQLDTFELNIQLRIETGILVLFGPSGSGKSMTIQMVAGLVMPDRGSISIGDRVLFDSSSGMNLKPQSRHVGYVPQHYAVFPHLTVEENVAFALYKGRRRVPKKRALSETRPLLDKFRLADLASSSATTLSGGQLQRVALARALVTQPEALLLDEPFAALDVPVKRELRDEFRKIQIEDSIPTIFITHDIEEAATVADEIAILIHGQIRQIGPTRQVLDFPADSDIAELVQARNILPGMAVRQQEEVFVHTPVGMLKVEQLPVSDAEPITVVIRPEKIRIVREHVEISGLLQENILEGVIVDARDHGTYTAVVCCVQDGTLEVSLSPTAAARLHVQVGKAVRLSIPPPWIHLIREGDQ